MRFDTDSMAVTLEQVNLSQWSGILAFRSSKSASDMKSASTQLAAHCADETTTLATCWKVTRKDGLVLGFTDHDQDLTVESLLYQVSTGYTRSAIHAISDLSVDNLDIESALNSDTLDAADLRDAVFKAELRGLTQALSQQIVELYTPDCRTDLGDARCKINLAALTVTGTVTAVSDQRGFTDTARTEADGYWSGGLVTWTSGTNAGRKMEIRSYAAHAFTLFLPMPGAIAVGDTYSLQPGCDKSFATCKARYANAVNFRGEPHVPGTDQTLAYPDSK